MQYYNQNNDIIILIIIQFFVLVLGRYRLRIAMDCVGVKSGVSAVNVRVFWEQQNVRRCKQTSPNSKHNHITTISLPIGFKYQLRYIYCDLCVLLAFIYDF